MQMLSQAQPKIPVVFLAANDHAPHQDMALRWLERSDAFDITVIGPTKGGLKARLAHVVRVRRALAGRRDNPIVYVSSHSNMLTAMLALAGGRRRPVVYHTQDFYSPRRYRGRAALEGRLLRRGDLIVVNEAARGAYLWERWGLARQPMTIPTYLPSWWPMPERSAEARARLLGLFPDAKPNDAIVFAGGPFTAMRQSANLIKCMALIPTHLRVVFSNSPPGHPTRVALDAAAAQAGVGDRVGVLPDLPHGELTALIGGADLGVLVYQPTDLGNVFQQPGRLTEFLRMGIPCIASPFSDARWLAARTPYVRLADGEDPADLALGLEQLARDLAANPQMPAEIVEFTCRELIYDPGGERLAAALKILHRR